jgi:hypothetical protein
MSGVFLFGPTNFGDRGNGSCGGGGGGGGRWPVPGVVDSTF